MSSSMTTSFDPTIAHYLAEYARNEKSMTGSNLPWLKQLRAQALNEFSAKGFPSTRDEAWKYTNVAPLAKQNFVLAAAPKNLSSLSVLPGSLPTDLNCYRLVFLNGEFAAEFSNLPNITDKNLQVSNLAQIFKQEPGLLSSHLGQLAAKNSSSFTALNTAFMQDGAYIRVARNTVVTQPIHLLFINTDLEQPAFNTLRNFIVLEENTQATIIQSYVSSTTTNHFTNAVTEILLAKDAQCDHYKLLQENDQAFHIDSLHVQQQAHSRLHASSFALKGGFTRSDIYSTLVAQHTECVLNGLYLGSGKQHIDHHTIIDHAQPHGTSKENYKGVLADRSRAVFNGKVIVRPGAQKTDAQQSNKTLLLSNDAEIDTKPELEIYNDDVRCTHGAAVGQLNEDALFYLRSRGINAEVARNILIYAFIRETLECVPLLPLRNYLDDYLKHKSFIS